jgi:hypothetical protein
MTRRSFRILAAVPLLLAALATIASAAKPWELLIPFKRVEADADKSYQLTDQHGPWMILAASFVGEGAERQARDLVQELRSEFNLEAYTHVKTYDFTESVVGLGVDPYGGPKKMRYANRKKFDEIAVLVGAYQGVEDPNVEKDLEKLKYAQPKCLDPKRREESSQALFSLRELHRRLTPNNEMRQRGPMGSAFVTRNPMLPEEFFAPKGLDPLVVRMNQNVEHSLLDSSGSYSVRIATFRGASTMKVDEIERNGKGLPSKLEEAALNAHRMTLALRKQGVEAYEFHDRYESIVTVGSFASVGTPRADGRTEMSPEILAILKRYEPKHQVIPGQAEVGLVPCQVDGIPCDVQPWPVAVPRASLAAAYSPNNRMFQ